MKDYEQHLLDEVKSGRLGRREFLRLASVVGLSLVGFTKLMGTPAWASTASSGESQAGHPDRGGVLHIASPVPSANPDPITASNEGEILTYQESLEYLCYPRADWTLSPRLATAWHPDRAAKVWTFEVRNNVRWHDGSLLTADDVVATFERLLNPKVGSSAASIYHGVLSYGNVEKLGKFKVRFHLDTPFVDFPYLVSGFAYQSAILPKNYEPGTFTKGGIGTGPFILTSYVPDQSATFTANPNYWHKGLPYMHQVKVTYYGDVSSAVLAMEAGNINAYPRMPIKGAETLVRNPKLKILRHPSASYRSLAMRVDKEPFSDKRVRQAIALCLDREAIVKELFAGATTMANDHSFAPVYPETTLVNEKIPQRRQNIAKAKALLEAAGHKEGLRLKLTTENLLEMPQYAVAIANYCQKAGIDVSLDIMPTNEYYGSGSDQPWLEVPFGMTDWAARGTASQAIIPEFPCGAVWNSAHWCNKEFDKIFKEYNGELDRGKRAKLALKLGKIQHDEVPVVIGYWIDSRRAVAKNVHGLESAPAPFIDLGGVWISKS